MLYEVPGYLQVPQAGRLPSPCSASPPWDDEAPTPASEVEQAPPFHFSRRREGVDEDGDSLSFILSPGDEEAAASIQPRVLDRVRLDQKNSTNAPSGHHFSRTLRDSWHGDPNRTNTKHMFSRSDTDLRHSGMPVILSKSALQSWMHSPPLTSAVAYAHAAISA